MGAPMKSSTLLALLLFTTTATWGAGHKSAHKPVPPEPVKTAPAPAPLFPAPPRFTAEYTVQADGFKVGEMSRAVKALGNDTYLIETRLHTTGLVSLFK